MLLREYGEVIEADFQRYYGLDLLDLYRGRLTPRKAMALIGGLPPGSAFHRARGGPAFWSDEVAAVKEMGHRVVSALIAVNGSRQSPKPPEPPPVGWRVEAEKQRLRLEAKILRHKARTAAQRQQAREAGT